MKHYKLKDSGIRLTDEHRYFDANNKEYFGITGLLSKHITKTDFSAIDPMILQIAIHYGSSVHKGIETLEQHGVIENEDIYPEMNSYIKLKEDSGLDVLTVEYIVSDFLRYASPIDILGVINNKVCIIDTKTTSVLNKTSVAWQLSIYKYLFSLVNPTIEIGGLYCLYFKDRACTLVDLSHMEVPVCEVESLFEAEALGTLYGEVVSMEHSFNQEVALELITQIDGLLRDINILKEEVSKRDDELRSMVESMPPFSINNDIFRLTKIRDSVRTSIDTTKLKKDLPDIAEKYKKETVVKGGLRYALKESK